MVETITQCANIFGVVIDGTLHAAGEHCFLCRHDEVAFEQRLPFKGFSFEDADGSLHDDVTSRGIGGRSIETSQFDTFDAFARSHDAIDARKADVVVGFQCLNLGFCSCSHPVAMGYDNIDIGIARKQGIHHVSSFIARPMCIDRGQQFCLGMSFELLDDATVTHLGGRSSHDTCEFKDSDLLRGV